MPVPVPIPPVVPAPVAPPVAFVPAPVPRFVPLVFPAGSLRGEVLQPAERAWFEFEQSTFGFTCATAGVYRAAASTLAKASFTYAIKFSGLSDPVHVLRADPKSAT